MAGFFSRTFDALKRLVGGGVKPPPTPTPPPPTTPPGGGRQREPTHVEYLQGHEKVLPRWTIGDGEHPLRLSEVHEFLYVVPPQRDYTIVVHGISPFNISEYFAYEEAWISYVVNRKHAIEQAYDPDVDTGTGWVNNMLGNITGYFWEEVWDVQIIDK